MDREQEIRRLVDLVDIYFAEADRCVHSKAFRAACVMIAAALEAGLLALAYGFADDLGERGPWPRAKPLPDPLMLSKLCTIAREAGWLPAAPPAAGQLDDQDKVLLDADVDDMLRFVTEARNTAAHPGKMSDLDIDDGAAFEIAYKIVRTAFDMTYWTVLLPAFPDGAEVR